MMTPQEVKSRKFRRAVLGGYSMAAVDKFLDRLREDYSRLYEDNEFLRARVAVLTGTAGGDRKKVSDIIGEAVRYRKIENAGMLGTGSVLYRENVELKSVIEGLRKNMENSREIKKNKDREIAGLKDEIAALKNDVKLLLEAIGDCQEKEDAVRSSLLTARKAAANIAGMAELVGGEALASDESES